MTYDNAIRAVADDSYRSASNSDLREMLKGCMDIHGSNPTALHRINHAAELIRIELTGRESAHQQQGFPHFEAAREVTEQSIRQSIETSDWTEHRLLTMVRAGIEESQNVEYKAAAALGRDRRNDMTKDVSAMAHGAGGVVIYGISESPDHNREHLPGGIDPVNRSAFPKEWVEHILAQIRPRIPDLKIHPVELRSGTDDMVYVIDVPEGKTAYQATDGRYYRRYNFEAVPMLDHEIRDVMNRRQHPRISVSASLVVFRMPERNDRFDGNLVIRMRNESDVLARYVGVTIDAPLRIRQKLIAFRDCTLDESEHGWCYTMSYSNHDGPPLFPKAQVTARFPFRFISRMEPEPQRKLSSVRYVVFADSMPRIEGVFEIEDILKLPAASVTSATVSSGS